MEYVYGVLLTISFVCGGLVYDPWHEDYKKSNKFGKIAIVVLSIVGIVGIVACYVLEVIQCCVMGMFNK